MNNLLVLLIVGLIFLLSFLKDYRFLKENKLLVWAVISNLIMFLAIAYIDSWGLFFEKYLPLAIIIGLYLVGYSFFYFMKDKRNLKQKYTMYILWWGFIIYSLGKILKIGWQKFFRFARCFAS